MIYLKNSTGEGVIHRGLWFDAGEYRELEKAEQMAWANASKIIAEIQSGTIVVALSNDGLNDLSADLGIITLKSSSDLNTQITSATGNVSTSSGTASTVSGMTKTPPAGSYLVQFNGSIYTGGASAIGEFGIYKNGVLVTETRRDISCNLQLLGGLITISLNTIGVGTYTAGEIVADGNDIIDVRYRSTNGGTIGFKERVLTLIKVK